MNSRTIQVCKMDLRCTPSWGCLRAIFVSGIRNFQDCAEFSHPPLQHGISKAACFGASVPCPSTLIVHLKWLTVTARKECIICRQTHQKASCRLHRGGPGGVTLTWPLVSHISAVYWEVEQEGRGDSEVSAVQTSRVNLAILPVHLHRTDLITASICTSW